MSLGDSVTVGRPAENGGYRVQLFARAVAAGEHLTFVGAYANGPAQVAGQAFPRAHEGHIGDTIEPFSTREGLDTIAVAALQEASPDVVLLLIGGNDVSLSNDLANAGVRFGRLLETMIETSPDALIVVGSVTPENVAAANPQVVALNARIAEVVSARAAAGDHVLMVDLYSALSETDADGDFVYMADKLHFTEEGYGVMGDLWYEALQPYLR